jgi:hypothetical protein
VKVIVVSELAQGRTREDLAVVRKRGVRALWELWRQGVLRAAYQRREAVGVVLELEVTGGDEAMKVLSELPAIKLGVLQVKELIVCEPLVALGALFVQGRPDEPSRAAMPRSSAR